MNLFRNKLKAKVAIHDLDRENAVTTKLPNLKRYNGILSSKYVFFEIRDKTFVILDFEKMKIWLNCHKIGWTYD